MPQIVKEICSWSHALRWCSPLKFPLLCELSKLDAHMQYGLDTWQTCWYFLYSVDEITHVRHCSVVENISLDWAVWIKVLFRRLKSCKWWIMPLSPRHGELCMLQQPGVKLEVSVAFDTFHGDSLHFAGHLWHCPHPTPKLQGNSILIQRPRRLTEFLWNSLWFGLLGRTSCHSSALDHLFP